MRSRLNPLRCACWVLLALGKCLSLWALAAYAGASVPYPDPTPALLAQQASEIRRAGYLLATGGALLALAVLGLWRLPARASVR